MYEIESKAHVLQRENVIQKLNSFATYGGKSEKKDIYYRIPTEFSPESYVSIRFRTEVFYSQDKNEKITYFTYKKKSIQKDKNSSAIEVNEEHECTISDFSAIETFIKDIGGKISLVKEKITEHWTYILNNEEMHIELCNVPPLGDFLEIETIKNQTDDETVKKIKKLQEQIFTKCDISLDQIEERFYRDMLKEAKI